MENTVPVACSETVPTEDLTKIRLKRAQSLLRRIDLRCWDDLRKRLPEQITEEFRDSSLVPFNFINRFPWHLRPWLREQVEQAFEHKRSFRYHREGKRRDLSIVSRGASNAARYGRFKTSQLIELLHTGFRCKVQAKSG